MCPGGKDQRLMRKLAKVAAVARYGDQHRLTPHPDVTSTGRHYGQPLDLAREFTSYDIWCRFDYDERDLADPLLDELIERGLVRAGQGFPGSRPGQHTSSFVLTDRGKRALAAVRLREES